MQIQTDIIGMPVVRPAMHETTALGAAFAAGLAVNIWRDLEELKSINRNDETTFEPQRSPEEACTMFQRWERAVAMSRGWLDTSTNNKSQNAKGGT